MLKKYPAVAALLPVVAGIILADNWSNPAWLWLVMAVAGVFVSLWFWARQNNAAVAGSVLATLLLLSGFSYSYAMKTFPPGHIIHYADGQSKYEIFATVDDWPVIKNKYTDIFALVDSLKTDGLISRADGRILIHIGSTSNFVQYGDRVILSGRLYPIRGSQNPNGFDYRRYLNLRSVFAVMYLPHQYGIRVDPAGKASVYRGIDYLRGQILGTFSANLGDSASALASGFLIGETRQIEAPIYDLFRETGTLHLLAVSGSNVGLIILVFLLLLKASPMKQIGRTVFLLVIILVFSFLSYNQPSVVRAALMAALVLLGRCFQRRIDYNNIVAAAALIILLVEPVQLYDVGFQLSFATAWGLIFIMPRVSVLFQSVHRSRLFRFLVFPLLVCLVAQIVSLPLSAYYFNRLPVISFLSNLVIVPLVSIAVIGEVLLLFAALVLPVFGTLVGSILNPLLLLIIKFLGFFNSIGWSLHRGFMPSLPVLFVYFVLVILAVIAIRSLRARRGFVFAAIISMIGLTAAGLFDSDGRDDITILSVSSGYIAVGRQAPSMVILADLSIKDYSYTEKIIQPLLDNWDIKNFDVVVISGNYTTVREGLTMWSLSDGGKLYLPQAYEGLARDIAHEMSMPLDSGTVMLLGPYPNPIFNQSASIYLTAGLAVYSMEQSRVVFADNGFDFPDSAAGSLDAIEDSYIIIPDLGVRHLRALEKLPQNNKIKIIANRLNPAARDYLRQNDPVADFSSNVIILSQVGAVSIVTQNGEFRVK